MGKKHPVKHIGRYWWRVMRDSFKDVFRESFMNNLEKIILLILVTAMLVSVGITTWVTLTQQFSAKSLYTAIALFVASVIVTIYHKPPELQAEAEEKISILNKDIEKLKYRLDLREYDDIEVSFRDDPLTDHQLGQLGHPSNNFFKLALRVTNNGGVSIRCGLRMVSLQYDRTGFIQLARWEGDEVPSERENNLTPVEMKLMKWDEGYVSEGKIDIPSHGGVGNLMFAETDRRPNLDFWFIYIDGKSRNQQSMQGRYWATLRLDGFYEKDGIRVELKPIHYEIEFTFQRNRLDQVVITKIRRDSVPS